MFNIGFGEMLVIMAVLLIFFGAERMPEIGRSLGRAASELRKVAQGLEDGLRGSVRDAAGSPPPVESDPGADATGSSAAARRGQGSRKPRRPRRGKLAG